MVADNLQKVEDFLRPLCAKGIALAFSGGVDSSLLLALLIEMKRKEDFPLLVLSARSTLQSGRDLDEIVSVAADYGVEVRFVYCDVLSIPEVRENNLLRCYHCKKMLFQTMLAEGEKEGITTLIEGSHGDDLKAYRPGRKALAELGVISPLQVLGISKTEIRAMAAHLGVRTALRPSSPCLATRFDYGVTLTEENLRRAGEGELLLRKVLPEEADLRVRVHGKLARIEVNEKFFALLLEHRTEILPGFYALGFEKVTLDIAGFASGSFDRKREESKNV